MAIVVFPRRLGWILAVSALSVHPLTAQVAVLSITPTTAWAPTISAPTLAGNDFPEYYESATNEYQFAVSGGGASLQWTVSVQRGDDSDWHSGLTLWVQRTGDGVPGGGGGSYRIQGPLNQYQEITPDPTYFFNGRRTRSGIPVQLRVSGAYIAAGVPPGSYTTTVIYTIADN